MIHIFFFNSVHLTIYRSAKSQPSSLRFRTQRLQHFGPLRSGEAWTLLNLTLRHTSKTHPSISLLVLA